LRAAEEGLAMARTLKSPALIFSNQLMLANLLHEVGQVRGAIREGKALCDLLTGELEVARLGAAGIPRSMALSFLGWFLTDIGEHAEGLDFSGQGLAIAVREQDPYSEVLARCALGRNLLALDRDADAIDCLAVAREISERNGYDAIKPNLAGRIATALSRADRAGEAIDIAEDCLRKGLHLRTGQLEVYYLYAGYAEALVRDGRTEEGFHWLDKALAIARRIDNPCWIVEGLGVRTRLLRLIAPDSPIEADLAERAELCERYGLAERSAPDPESPATGRGKVTHRRSTKKPRMTSLPLRPDARCS
jgi:tetratricopeptide (TPR) repeat protein